MNRILGQHPEVEALNELHYLGSVWDIDLPLKDVPSKKAEGYAALLLMRIRNGLWDGMAGEKEISDAKLIISKKDTWTHWDIYRRVLDHESGQGSKFVTDQTPRNTFFVSSILELFSTARIIHMIRDPRAVLASQRNRWKIRWLGAETMPIRNSLRVLVNYHPYTLTKLWIESARVAKRHSSDERYKIVKFEEVTQNPEKEIRAVCQFLGLEFRPSLLEVPQVGSSSKVHDAARVGVSSDVVDTWKRTLPEGDVVICERMAAELMKDYSYEPVSKPGWGWRVLGPLIRFPFHVIGAALLNPRVIYLHIRSMAKRKW